MLRHRPPDSLDTFGRPWPCAQSTMKSAASVRHCGALTKRPAASPGTAARRIVEIAGRVAVPQPASPLLMGCSAHFFSSPPLRYLRPCAYYAYNRLAAFMHVNMLYRHLLLGSSALQLLHGFDLL